MILSNSVAKDCSLMKVTDLFERISKISGALCLILFFYHSTSFFKNFSSVLVVSSCSVVAMVDVETGKLAAELPGMCHGYQVQHICM